MLVTINGEVNDLSEQIIQIKNATEDVTLVINSPGGDVFEGLQMVKAIENCPYKVIAKVEVMAASIAAIIALACTKVAIGKNDIMMLHNSWMFAKGNKEELQSCIDAMKTVDVVLHNIIGEHCQDENLLNQVNNGDVWLVGEEVAAKFNHVELVEVGTQSLMASCASLAALVKAAKAAREETEEEQKKKKQNVPPQPEPEPEPEPDPDPDPDPENPDDPDTPDDPDDPDNTDPDNTDGDGGDGGDGEGGDTPPEPSGYVITEKLKALLKEAKELE